MIYEVRHRERLHKKYALKKSDFLIYSGSMDHGKKITAEDAERRRDVLFFSACLCVLDVFLNSPSK